MSVKLFDMKNQVFFLLGFEIIADSMPKNFTISKFTVARHRARQAEQIYHSSDSPVEHVSLDKVSYFAAASAHKYPYSRTQSPHLYSSIGKCGVKGGASPLCNEEGHPESIRHPSPFTRRKLVVSYVPYMVGLKPLVLTLVSLDVIVVHYVSVFFRSGCVRNFPRTGRRRKICRTGTIPPGSSPPSSQRPAVRATVP